MDSKARGRKKDRRHIGDSQRGRWGSRANDLSGTGPGGPHGPAENALPHGGQPSTQGPLSQPPDPLPGWLGAGSTRGEGMSLLSTSLPSQTARQLSPHQPDLAFPAPGPWQGQDTAGSLAWGKVSKLRGRVPATHTEVQEEKAGGGERGRAGKRGLQVP